MRDAVFRNVYSSVKRGQRIELGLEKPHADDTFGVEAPPAGRRPSLTGHDSSSRCMRSNLATPNDFEYVLKPPSEGLFWRSALTEIEGNSYIFLPYFWDCGEVLSAQQGFWQVFWHGLSPLAPLLHGWSEAPRRCLEQGVCALPSYPR